jgi:hypothetical protein
MKRARGDKPVAVALTGREQFLLSPDVQKRVGKKYCDECQLLPLLIVHGLVRRVRTLQIDVRPLGGDSFKVTLDASSPSVGEAKAEIARLQGTPKERQELYKVAVRADGSAVREDDEEPELLEKEDTQLSAGDTVTMAVKAEEPLMWRTFPADMVKLTENDVVATQIADEGDGEVLVTSGIVISGGRHYWEVELLCEDFDEVCVGVSRPNLNPRDFYGSLDSTDGWFITPYSGGLWGNGKERDDRAGPYEKSDRVGVLLDLDEGSLQFFKNGLKHGPGFPAGSVTAPVVHAVQLGSPGEIVRLLKGNLED